jgi:Domain of unknown function (DUF4124)
MVSLLRLLLVGIALLAAMSASAGSVYRCESDDGSVSYTDQPCAADAEELNIEYEATDESSIIAQQRQADELRAQADAAAAEAAAVADIEARNQEARDQKCVAARARKEQLVTMPRMGTRGEDGERRRYNDEELAAAFAEADSQVAEYCGG